jgi:hypothetical protein
MVNEIRLFSLLRECVVVVNLCLQIANGNCTLAATSQAAVVKARIE